MNFGSRTTDLPYLTTTQLAPKKQACARWDKKILEPQNIPMPQSLFIILKIKYIDRNIEKIEKINQKKNYMSSL